MSKNKRVHIVSILDRSGSMGPVAEDVINGYNSFVKESRASGRRFSLRLFDDRHDVVYSELKGSLVPELTNEVYRIRGWTALNDAIALAIREFEGKKNVIFMINTDGHENRSTEFPGVTGTNKIRALVEAKTALGWEFVFMGAGLSDAEALTLSLSRGIARNRTYNVARTSKGIGSTYTASSALVDNFASHGVTNDEVVNSAISSLAVTPSLTVTDPLNDSDE